MVLAKLHCKTVTFVLSLLWQEFLNIWSRFSSLALCFSVRRVLFLARLIHQRSFATVGTETPKEFGNAKTWHICWVSECNVLANRMQNASFFHFCVRTWPTRSVAVSLFSFVSCGECLAFSFASGTFKAQCKDEIIAECRRVRFAGNRPQSPNKTSHLVTFRCLSGSQDCRLLRKRFSSVSKWNRVIDETKNLTLNLLTLLCSWYKEKSAHAPRTDSRTHFPVGVYRQSTLAHWTFFSETWASSEPSCVASAGTDWETKIELGAEQNKSSLDWIRQQQSLYFTKNRYFRKLLFTPS